MELLNIILNSQKFVNFQSKFSFASMKNYVPKVVEVHEQVYHSEIEEIYNSERVFYFIDVVNVLKYTKCFIDKQLYPLPMFFHMWDENGVVDDDLNYNCLNRYYSLKYENYQVKAMFFDRNRFCGEEINEQYFDNEYNITSELLPNKSVFKMLGFDKVVLITDNLELSSDLIESVDFELDIREICD